MTFFDGSIQIWLFGALVNVTYLQMPLQICVLTDGSLSQSGVKRLGTQMSTMSLFQMGPLEVVRKALRPLGVSLRCPQINCILLQLGL